MASGAYVHAVEEAAGAAAGVESHLESAACPGFVEFVERGQTTGDEVTVLAERLLAPVRAADVDALLLGCTHYPFLARVIGDVMGHAVTLVSSADETAFAAYRVLGELGLLRTDGAASAPTASCRAATSRRSASSAPGCSGPSSTTPHPGRRPRTDPQRGTPMPRPDGRAPDELRPISFERDFTEMAAGSCLVSFGRTRVLCTAQHRRGRAALDARQGKGWVTAEYSMLPGSSPERVDREAARGKQSGRTVEIQRLIGRSLRAACDMTVLGERQVVVDCDVLQADGGTRTASICGGYLALHDALARLVAAGRLASHPLHSYCAAISVGIVGGVPVLDLPYVEDSAAEVDMNVVMLRPTAGGEPRFVEVQGTAEGMAFTRGELDELLVLAELGLAEIVDLQAEMVSVPPAVRRR